MNKNKSRRTIFFVSDTHWFKDNRVMKSISSFLNNGDSGYVFDIYYQFLGTENKIFYENGINCVKTDRPIFKNKVFFEFLSNTDYDVLYLHNVNIFESNLLLDALKKGSLIIYDCHEYVPSSYILSSDEARVFENNRKEIVNRLFEKFISVSHGIVVVSEMMKKLIMDNFGVPQDKILKFTNYAPFGLENVKPLEERRKEIAIVGFTPRNMEREVDILNTLSHTFEIKIIGMKNDVNFFGENNLNLNKKVKYLPFLPYEKLLEELSCSMFSFISFKSFLEWNQQNLTLALPNKFFDSMAAGVPVIVSSEFVELSESVQNDGVGIVINPENPKESLEKIFEYSQNDKYNALLNNIVRNRSKYIYDDEKKQILRNFVLKYLDHF